MIYNLEVAAVARAWADALSVANHAAQLASGQPDEPTVDRLEVAALELLAHAARTRAAHCAATLDDEGDAA